MNRWSFRLHTASFSKETRIDQIYAVFQLIKPFNRLCWRTKTPFSMSGMPYFVWYWTPWSHSYTAHYVSRGTLWQNRERHCNLHPHLKWRPWHFLHQWCRIVHDVCWQSRFPVADFWVLTRVELLNTVSWPRADVKSLLSKSFCMIRAKSSECM